MALSIAVPSAALPGTGTAVSHGQSVAKIAWRSKSRRLLPAPRGKRPCRPPPPAPDFPQPRLGMGRHGSVFARSSRAGAPAEAIKILPAGEACLRELWALNEVCSHPSIVQVRRATVLRAGGAGWGSSSAASGPVATVELALELCAGGDLLQRLQASPSAAPHRARRNSHLPEPPPTATGAGAATSAPAAAAAGGARAAAATSTLPAGTPAAARRTSSGAAAASAEAACSGDEQTSTVGGRLSECECRNVMAGIAAALSMCHRRGVAHGDLKPENVLLPDVSAPVATVMSIRLCDFTAACPVGVRSGRECAASAEYASPEAARACRLCATTGPRGQAARQQAAAAAGADRRTSPTRSPATTSAGSPASATHAVSGSPSSRAAAAAGPAWYGSDAADIWSLGSLGLTLLIGRSPFRFETAPPGQTASDPQMSFGSDDDLDGSHSASLASLACLPQAKAASMRLFADLQAARAQEDEAAAESAAQTAVVSAVEAGGATLSGPAASFFASLLHIDPARRPTVAAACAHPWIASLLAETDPAGVFLPAGEPLRQAAQAKASLDDAAKKLAAPKPVASPANPRLRVSQSAAAGASMPDSPVAALTAKLGRALSFGDDVTPPPALTLRARMGAAVTQPSPDPPSPMRGNSGRKRSVSHREAKSPAQSPRGFAGVPRLAREFPLPFTVRPAAAAQAAMRLGTAPAAAAAHQASSSSSGQFAALDSAAVLHTLPSLASPVSTASDNGSEAPPSLTLSRGPGSPPPKRVHRPLKGADG